MVVEGVVVVCCAVCHLLERGFSEFICREHRGMLAAAKQHKPAFIASQPLGPDWASEPTRMIPWEGVWKAST